MNYQTAKSKMFSKMVDMEAENIELKAHNLELTQALKWYADFDKNYDESTCAPGHYVVIPSSPNGPEDWDFDADCGHKAEQVLSSPASQKYLAMIEVVEAVRKQYEVGLDGFVPKGIADAFEALESEEA